jgi:crotonobetainyl-CoA:carnitine CoA-transferase CaiB-like acyl-CoA transferase
MQQQTTDWWLAKLNEVGVPCGPICTIDQVFDNPQIQARNMQLELNHATLGKVASVANPIKYSATPIQYPQAPPTLGQHTDEVLHDWLGIEAGEG